MHQTQRNIGSTLRGGYRYSFQGYEGDTEIKGEGNSYTTEFRQYDPRLGRWLSLDPMKCKYPSFSPYCGIGNNPIVLMDSNGDTLTWANDFKTLCLRAQIGYMRMRSQSFDIMMNNLETCAEVIHIQVNEEWLDENYGETTNGLFTLNKTTGERNVYLRFTSSELTITEELFHAFQSIVYATTNAETGEIELTRGVHEIEAEANLMQIFVLAELDGSIFGGRGAIFELTTDEFFNALEKNQYIVTEGSEVSVLYFNYLELEQLLNNGGIKPYQGEQRKLLPEAFNKVLQMTIIADEINPPSAGINITVE